MVTTNNIQTTTKRHVKTNFSRKLNQLSMSISNQKKKKNSAASVDQDNLGIKNIRRMNGHQLNYLGLLFRICIEDL